MEVPTAASTSEIGMATSSCTNVSSSPPSAPSPLPPQRLVIGPDAQLTFEERCSEIEQDYHGLGCPCCAGEESQRCLTCTHAVGFHRCQRTGQTRWRRGTLHGGALDVQETLLALCKRNVPLQVLAEKIKRYLNADLLNREDPGGAPDIATIRYHLRTS